MRYVAHSAGASLITVSKKDKTQMNLLRSMLNHHVFGTALKTTVSLDASKPLYIPAGEDKIEAIGTPPGARDYANAGRDKRTQMWKARGAEAGAAAGAGAACAPGRWGTDCDPTGSGHGERGGAVGGDVARAAASALALEAVFGHWGRSHLARLCPHSRLYTLANRRPR